MILWSLRDMGMSIIGDMKEQVMHGLPNTPEMCETIAAMKTRDFSCPDSGLSELTVKGPTEVIAAWMAYIQKIGAPPGFKTATPDDLVIGTRHELP